MLYWVYANWMQNRARVHLGSCGFCNHGAGIHSVADNESGQWLGPFDDFDTALREAKDVGQLDVRSCRVCRAGNSHGIEESIPPTMRASVKMEDFLGKEREWVFVRDPMVVDLRFSSVEYIDRSHEGQTIEPRYAVGFAMEPKADIVAYDVRFVFFDIWEKHLTTWQATETIDIPRNEWRSVVVLVWDYCKVGASWLSLHEKYQTCLVYVQQIRLKNGSIVKNHTDQILDVVRYSSAQFGKSTVPVRIDGRRTVHNAQYVNTK